MTESKDKNLIFKKLLKGSLGFKIALIALFIVFNVITVGIFSSGTDRPLASNKFSIAPDNIVTLASTSNISSTEGSKGSSLAERLKYLLAHGNRAPKEVKFAPSDKLRGVANLIDKVYVNPTKTEDLYSAALSGMVSSLDPHSEYLPPKEYKALQDDIGGSFGGLGIQVTKGKNGISIISPIDDTPAYKAGIKSGDVIVMIDEKAARNMSVSDAVKLMRGKPGSDIKISVYRASTQTIKTYTITRAIINSPAVKVFAAGENMIYIRVSQFQKDVSSDIVSAVKKLTKSGQVSGVLLDLRNNPGGILNEAVSVSDLFLGDGVVVSSKSSRDSHGREYRSYDGDIFEGVPLVLLVNSGSASASEIVSGAIKDRHRGLLVGEKTFGKGSVQSIMPFKDGSAIKLTTALYYTPSGVSIQNIGITPDITTHPEPSLVDNKNEDNKEANTIRRLLRESSLSNHLARDKTVKVKKKASGDPMSKEFSKYLARDYVLRQGVDVLKALRLSTTLTKMFPSVSIADKTHTQN